MPPAMTLRRWLLGAALAVSLAAPAAADAAFPVSLVVVLSDDTLYGFEGGQLAAPTSSVAVQGLTAGDTLVGIDVRPQNGFLYGLARNPAAGTIRLYSLSVRTGQATPLGVPIATTGTTFGVDFDPTADRLRIVTDTGRNLRLDPNTGALVATDADINGATVGATAYTNNQPGATVTTQYTLSAAGDQLFIQSPPNGGTQTLPLPVKARDGNASDFAGGFDIPPGVDAPANNQPATGTGLAALRFRGIYRLYEIDLASGVLSLVGAIDDRPVQGLAIQQEVVPDGLPALALTADGQELRRFNTAAPGTAGAATISGVVNGEALVGLAWRPQTGQLLGLGVNPPADTGTLYRIDPQSGAAAALGPAGQVAFTADGGTAVDLPDPAAAGYGFDIDATTDRVRVVTGTGLNFRVDPSTGAPLDGDLGTASGSVTGTNPDGSLNGLPAGSTGLVATALTNAFGQGPGGATTQYGLDATSDTLFVQSPPNRGTVGQGKAVTVNGAPLDFSAAAGFDIPPAVRVAASGARVAGTALATLTVGGSAGLYTIELSTGAAVLRPGLAAAPTLAGLAVGDGPPPFVVRPVALKGFPWLMPKGSVFPGVPTHGDPPPPAFAKSTRVTLKLATARVPAAGPVVVVVGNANPFGVKGRLAARTPRAGRRKAVALRSVAFSVGWRGTTRLRLRLPATTRRTLRRTGRLTLRVTATVRAPRGAARTVAKTLTLRLERAKRKR